MRSILVLILLILGQLALSQINDSGAYINANIGYGYKSNATGYDITNNNSYTLGIDSGYAFNNYFALDSNVSVMPNNSQSSFNNYILTAIDARGAVGFSEFFSPYIRLGVGALFNTTIINNTLGGAFIGVGGVFKLNNSLGISVDNYGIFVPSNLSSNVNIFALGMTYGF